MGGGWGFTACTGRELSPRMQHQFQQWSEIPAREEEMNDKKPQRCSWPLKKWQTSQGTTPPKSADRGHLAAFSPWVSFLLLLPFNVIWDLPQPPHGLWNPGILSHFCVTWGPMHNGNHGKDKNNGSYHLLSTYCVLHMLLGTPFTYLRNEEWAL